MTHILTKAGTKSLHCSRGLRNHCPHVTELTPSRQIKVVSRLVLIALLAVLLSVFSVVTAAQEVGAIKGTVVDEKAAHIPGAKVKLTQQSSGHETEVTTDETGAFSFDNQPAGDYTLTAIALGFKLAERKLTVAITPAPPVQIS